MVHCWVCDSKGRKIQTLLKRLRVDSKKIRKVFEIYGDDYIVTSTSTDEEKVELRLPSEFKSLLVKPKGLNPLYKKVVQWPKKIGESLKKILLDIILVIVMVVFIPIVLLFLPTMWIIDLITSFESVFTEEKFKYKKSSVSKNVTIFENQVNWKKPITLCEGVFDWKMSIKRKLFLSWVNLSQKL